ncbi:MAG TPA: hypothetical protein VM368_03905 [Flavisolibacter sp.]|nr:hypothetical protein [Flavisolibacter sp.]
MSQNQHTSEQQGAAPNSPGAVNVTPNPNPRANENIRVTTVGSDSASHGNTKSAAKDINSEITDGEDA